MVTVVPGFVRPTMQTHPELKHVAPFSFTLLFTICRVKQNTKTLWFSEFLFLVNGVTIHLFSQARNLGIILNSFLSSFSYSVTNIDCSLSDISSVYLIFILCITRVGLHYLSLGLSKQPHNWSFLLLLTSSVLYSTSSVICLWNNLVNITACFCLSYNAQSLRLSSNIWCGYLRISLDCYSCSKHTYSFSSFTKKNTVKKSKWRFFSIMINARVSSKFTKNNVRLC